MITDLLVTWGSLLFSGTQLYSTESGGFGGVWVQLLLGILQAAWGQGPAEEFLQPAPLIQLGCFPLLSVVSPHCPVILN